MKIEIFYKTLNCDQYSLCLRYAAGFKSLVFKFFHKIEDWVYLAGTVGTIACGVLFVVFWFLHRRHATW